MGLTFVISTSIMVKQWEQSGNMELRNEDVHIRVIDQRIGMGVGGLDTVIRLYHSPTGILIEMPRVTRNQFHDKRIAFEMLEYALADKELVAELESKNG
jgi:protein subunit release factor A